MFPHTLYVLRHGETEWNRQGRMQGTLDSPLTDLGLAQAEAQRRILDVLDLEGFAWIASPQGRAQATARIVARGREVATDARLAEISVGDWNGAMRDEIQAVAPHLFEHDTDLIWYDQAPGGEGFSALEARCRSFLAELSGPAVLITHGITSRFLRCLALGQPTDAFAEIGGGQGCVYRIKDGKQEKRDLQATPNLR